MTMEIRMRQAKVHYQGWDIIPFAIETADGNWEASCELEREGPEGLETFQGVSANLVHHDKERALSLAVSDARRKIDDMVADPVFQFGKHDTL